MLRAGQLQPHAQRGQAQHRSRRAQPDKKCRVLHTDPARLLRQRYSAMTVRASMLRIFRQEDLNFLLTNRIPRQLLTRFMGWFSKIEQPLVRDLSIGIWRLFADLRLDEAKKERFASLHDCFIRELKPGARPIDEDPGVLASPCDAIVGACGRLRRHPVAAGQGLPLHAVRSARRCGAGRRLPRRPLRDAAHHLEHVPPLPRAARLPRVRRSPTSRATPGTSTRSRSSASRSCSARTSAR